MKNTNTKLKVAITSDHAGFELKQKIRLNLESLGFGILDLGPNNSNPVDYPDYGKAIANEIIKYGQVNRAWIGDFKFKRGYYNKNNERVPALYVFGIDNSNIKGGLRDGDIIIDIKGTEARWNTLKASVNSILPGEILELTIDRSGEIISLEITTRERPNIPQVL